MPGKAGCFFRTLRTRKMPPDKEWSKPSVPDGINYGYEIEKAQLYRCAVLCCAVLCCAVLCCAVLCECSSPCHLCEPLLCKILIFTYSGLNMDACLPGLPYKPRDSAFVSAH